MNYGEEQRNELEALSEIYFNEIKFISKENPISFSIKVRPQASSYDDNEQSQSNDYEKENDQDYDSDEDDEDDIENDQDELIADDNQQSQDISVELRFDLPEKYPDEKPSMQIINSQNLDQNDLSTLMENLNQKAEESLGTVMVFMLVSDVVEWLITKTEESAIEIEQEKETKLKEIEAEEQKRFDGTPVTESTFLAWKAKFDAEMLKAKFEQQKQQQSEQSATKRLTGRAMFESDKTLAESDLNFVEDLDQNQIEALLHNIEELDVDEDDDEFDIEESEEDEDEEFDIDDEDEDDDLDEEEEDLQQRRAQDSKGKQKTKSTQKIIKSNT